MNLVKRFFMDSMFWNGYEGNWLLIKNLNLNGPSFGGVVGTTRSFAQFLQDQLQAEPIILRPESKRLLETQQSDNHGKPIPMTLGWHIGGTNGLTYFFKEGGGGGYHSEMRLYPQKDMASVMMVNRTNFNSNDFLNRVDEVLLDS
jgi:CubicO group peptidase (beta-lactamase class C family)